MVLELRIVCTPLNDYLNKGVAALNAFRNLINMKEELPLRNLDLDTDPRVFKTMVIPEFIRAVLQNGKV